MTGGRDAATFASEAAVANPPDGSSLSAIDAALGDRGQTTLVALELTLAGEVRGVSVGDSRAWARGPLPSAWRELTADQVRKPLVGSGRARPIGFAARDVEALVVASDGSCDYLSEDALIEGLKGDLLALAESVRLATGTLRDDVSLLVVQRAP